MSTKLSVTDKRLISGIFLVLMINMLQAFLTPISEDEAYYWLWSQYPDWGYFDHPPMVAWWISIGYKIFPNELGVRLLTVLFNASSLIFLWKIVNPQGLKQVKLFWVSVLSVLLIHFFGFITTPDAPLLFFTLFYVFVLQKFIHEQNRTNTILLGFAIAGLVYSKYHGILVIIFTLIPLIREFYKNHNLYYAVLFGIILYTPHIVWLFSNDFIPIRYHFIERSSDEHFEWRKLGNYLGMYFLGAAPLLSYFILRSIISFNSKDLFQKSIWCLAVFPGFFFLLSVFKDNVQPQWLLISFVAMIILLYWNYAEKENLKWIFGLGIAGVVLILILRILIAIPSLSPFHKNELFAQSIRKFKPVNPVFEKYQEASIYKFFNPHDTVRVHRTLGNRKSQFDLWNWEESANGKTITYISPWILSVKSFKGFKNRNYYLKEIENYQTFQMIKVKTLTKLETVTNEKINLGLKIFNDHDREIAIGGNSNFQFSVNYYQDIQYNIIYSQMADMSQIILAPGEELDIQISFQNTDKPGNYKMCVGINNLQVGTTYVSNIVDVTVKD